MSKTIRYTVLIVAIALMVVGVGITHPAFADGPFLVTVTSTTPVYDAPSPMSDVMGQFTAGQNWYIIGADTTHKWVEVQITPSVTGWAPASAFAVDGSTLPVIAGETGTNMSAAPNSIAPAPIAPAPVIATGPVNVTVPYLTSMNATVNVYDAPSTTNSNLIGQLTAGQTWFVLGRDTTSKWVQVQITTSVSGWAPASGFALAGVSLPVIAGVTGS